MPSATAGCSGEAESRRCTSQHREGDLQFVTDHLAESRCARGRRPAQPGRDTDLKIVLERAQDGGSCATRANAITNSSRHHVTRDAASSGVTITSSRSCRGSTSWCRSPNTLRALQRGVKWPSARAGHQSCRQPRREDRECLKPGGRHFSAALLGVGGARRLDQEPRSNLQV